MHMPGPGPGPGAVHTVHGTIDVASLGLRRAQGGPKTKHKPVVKTEDAQGAKTEVKREIKNKDAAKAACGIQEALQDMKQTKKAGSASTIA